MRDIREVTALVPPEPAAEVTTLLWEVSPDNRHDPLLDGEYFYGLHTEGRQVQAHFRSTASCAEKPRLLNCKALVSLWIACGMVLRSASEEQVPNCLRLAFH